ncbi:MAG TPA: flippase [Coleofasciculaceae cyanobacterium]
MRDKNNAIIALQRFSISFFSGLYRKAIASDFIRKVAGTFASKVILMGLTFITSVLVTRILGPRDRGFYSVAVATAAMGVQFSNLGLHLSNIYYVSKERSLLSPLLGNSLIFSLLFGGLVASLTGIVFSLWSHLAPIPGILLGLALVGIPLGLPYLFLQNLILGTQKVFIFNVIELSNQVIFLGFVLLLIASTSVEVKTVFAASLLASCIGVMLQIWHLWPYVEHPPKPSFKLLKDNIGYGLKAYLAALFFNLALKTNLLMIQYFLGPEQAGYYAVADNFATLVYTFPLIIGLLLFPKLSAQESLGKSWILVKKVTLIVSTITGGICLLVALLSKPIITLIYGDNFLPAASICAWLMPAVFFLGVQVIVMQFNAATGYPVSVVFIRVIGLVLIIAYNALFLKYGIQHAAIGATISYACMAFLLLWIGKRKIHEQVA